MLSPVPNLEGGQDWPHAGRSLTGGASPHALEASCCPDLSSQIVTSRIATPLDFASRLNAYRGAAFGLEPILRKAPGSVRTTRSEDVRNLFLVGAGTHPGAGLPGVLSSARILDKVAPHASAFA